MQELKEFINMGGYAFYVWSSYGVCFIVLLINVLIPVWREKKLYRMLANRKNRVKQINESSTS